MADSNALPPDANGLPLPAVQQSLPDDISTPDSDGVPSASPNAAPGTNRLLIGCLAALVVFLIFAVGAGVGFGFGLLASRPATSAASSNPASAATVGDNQLRASLDEHFGTFWQAMDVLYANFYGELPQGDTATYAAVRGVVSSLGDANTSFYSPEEADVFRTNISGAFEGIGARVEWDEASDSARIVEPFENQPAWNAGIKRDDLIVAVDGASIVGSDLNSAVAKIRGAKGSTVVLSIVRQGENDDQPFDIDVIRDRVETPTVTTDALGDGGEIAYVRLYTFNENAGSLVRQAVEDATQRGAEGIILDLRGNSGGLLREAVKISSLFLDDAIVLQERFKDGNEETYHTEGNPIAPTVPMVVLVNEGSASASEIVAGALQDAGRAQLIGATTYGKGSVQLPETLDDGSIMRVTIARWYTPEGRTIDGTGLTPDIEVALSEEDRARSADPQLDRALAEVLAHIPLAPTPQP